MASLATLRKLLEPQFLSDSSQTSDTNNRVSSPSSLTNQPEVSPSPASYAPVATATKSTPVGWLGDNSIVDTSGLNFSNQYGNFATQASNLDRLRTNADYQRKEGFRLSDEQFNRDIGESNRLKQLAQTKLIERMATQGILNSGITLSEGGNLQGDFSRYLDDLNYEHTNRNAGIQKGFIDYVNQLAQQKEGLFGQQQQAEQAAKLEEARRAAEAQARAQQQAQMQALLQQQAAIQQANQEAMIAAINAGRSQYGGYSGPQVSGGGGGGYSRGSQAPTPAPAPNLPPLSWQDLVSRSGQIRSGSHGAVPLQGLVASTLQGNPALAQQVAGTYAQMANDINRVGYSYLNPSPSMDELIKFMINPEGYRSGYISPIPL